MINWAQIWTNQSSRSGEDINNQVSPESVGRIPRTFHWDTYYVVG